MPNIIIGVGIAATAGLLYLLIYILRIYLSDPKSVIETVAHVYSYGTPVIIGIAIYALYAFPVMFSTSLRFLATMLVAFHGLLPILWFSTKNTVFLSIAAISIVPTLIVVLWTIVAELYYEFIYLKYIDEVKIGTRIYFE